MEVVFTVNGQECRITARDMAPDTSLNTYLRSHLCLTGTKFMCQEGGCGCCIVTLQGVQPVTRENFTLAVNSCLFLAFSCHGLDITTIEGLGDRKRGYHEIQERLAQFHGTQCGFCSPGFVMNMYSLYTGKFESVTAEEVEDEFGGNICRCTGYRPILDAFKSFATNASQELKSLCADIEDLSLKKCRKSGKTCAGSCRGAIHITAAENAEWHKVYSLAEVLQTLVTAGDRKYRLVAGNTAHGIFKIPYDIAVFIDVSSVSELRSYSISDTIVLGGNITITEWMAILQEAADRTALFNYCRLVRDHLNRIATVPVRNVGTIAGNLMIKHDHHEFYSDVFLLLETVGATITITDTNGALVTVSPVDFLSENMQKRVITQISMPQLAPDRYHLRSYKMTDRAQNAITYMNAGFLFEMNTGSNIVVSSRIVYGGVNPSFIHATSIENYLDGEDLFNNTVIQAVVDIIDQNFIFDDSLPNSSAEFRRKLAVGLFYKTVLNLAPSSIVTPSYLSGSTLISRPLSSGQQNYETTPARYPLGQPIMKVEAMVQCSGEAEYVNDIFLHNALWATFVLSNDPLKTIASIDASEALAVPGVKAFYSAQDIPGVNSFVSQKNPAMPTYADPEEVFCSGKVLFHGQPVGVIVAEEMPQAVHAADLVTIQYKVEEEEPMTSFFRYFKKDTTSTKEKVLPTLEDVLKEDPKLIDNRLQIPIVVHMATQQGIDQAGNNIRGNLLCGPQYHYHMETQQTIVIPTDNGMTLYPSTQWMDFTNTGVAQVLGMPNNAFDIRVRRVGGAFGAKVSRSTQISAAAAVACHHLQRPIRMVLPMITNMRAIGKRTPAFSEYDVDFTNQGYISRLHCDVTHDLGCSNNEPMGNFSDLYVSNVYQTSTWTVVFQHVLTEAPSNTWMRAPASTIVIGNAETVMEHIAWALKMDPVQVRLINMTISNPMRQIYPDFLASCDYYTRVTQVNQFNDANRWRKRGIATSVMQYPLRFINTFESLVSIYHGDGSVVINLGGIETGQGINTKCTQIAAAVLRVPIELVKIKAANNVVSANTMVSAADMSFDAVGTTVKVCCEILNARLAPFRLLYPLGPWEDIVQAAYLANIELVATHQFTPEQNPTYIVYGAACAEIEIDVLTGDFQLRRVDIVEDIGQSISPRIDVGQVEGAFIMGMGYWLHEKLVYNRTNGELLTNRAWNYKPPGAKDIPVDFRVTLLRTTSTSAGVFGSKGCGEPAVTLGIAAIFALRRALESSRKDAGAEDIFLTLNSATTKEEILQLAGTQDDQFVL